MGKIFFRRGNDGAPTQVQEPIPADEEKRFTVRGITGGRCVAVGIVCGIERYFREIRCGKKARRSLFTSFGSGISLRFYKNV